MENIYFLMETNIDLSYDSINSFFKKLNEQYDGEFIFGSIIENNGDYVISIENTPGDISISKDYFCLDVQYYKGIEKEFEKWVDLAKIMMIVSKSKYFIISNELDNFSLKYSFPMIGLMAIKDNYLSILKEYLDVAFEVEIDTVKLESIISEFAYKKEFGDYIFIKFSEPFNDRSGFDHFIKHVKNE